MESIQHWLRYRGIVPAAFWAFERDLRVGLHSHIGVAVPAHLITAFKEHCVKQLRSDTGLVLPGMPYFKRLAKVSDRVRWASYSLKGVDHYNADWAPAFEGIGITRSGQGNIPFKRCGLTRGIDRAARAKAGYVDLKKVPELAEFVFDVMHSGLLPETQLSWLPTQDQRPHMDCPTHALPQGEGRATSWPIDQVDRPLTCLNGAQHLRGIGVAPVQLLNSVRA